MSVDIGRVVRLLRAVHATLQTLPESEAPYLGTALSDAYGRFRLQAQTLLPEEHSAEWDALFPPWVEKGPPLPAGAASWRLYNNKARGLLGQLEGWLEGIIDEAQVRAQAEADAIERLRKERAVGFGSSPE